MLEHAATSLSCGSSSSVAMCGCSRPGQATGVHSTGKCMVLADFCSGSMEATRMVGVLSSTSRLSGSGGAHRLGLLVTLETIENSCTCLHHGRGWPQTHIPWWRPEQVANAGTNCKHTGICEALGYQFTIPWLPVLAMCA